MYATVDDAMRRVVNSVVVLNGAPVWVRDARMGETGVELGFRPVNGGRGTTWRNVNDFAGFAPCPTGFVNYFGVEGARNPECVLTERLPSRRTRQGWCAENFHASTVRGGYRYSIDQIRACESFVEMVAGLYPSWDETLAVLYPGAAIAISREFALRTNATGIVEFYHRREPIGYVLRGQLYLRSDRAYMREQIIEDPSTPNNVEIA